LSYAPFEDSAEVGRMVGTTGALLPHSNSAAPLKSLTQFFCGLLRSRFVPDAIFLNNLFSKVAERCPLREQRMRRARSDAAVVAVLFLPEDGARPFRSPENFRQRPADAC